MFLFLVFTYDIIRHVDFTYIAVFKVQTQQVITSQIMSHIEYLVQTYYILVLIL